MIVNSKHIQEYENNVHDILENVHKNSNKYVNNDQKNHHLDRALLGETQRLFMIFLVHNTSVKKGFCVLYNAWPQKN